MIGKQFDRKPATLLSLTLYKSHVAAHVILKVHEEDAMKDALLRGRQQADWHIKQNVITLQSRVREGGPRALEATKRRDEA